YFGEDDRDHNGERGCTPKSPRHRLRGPAKSRARGRVLSQDCERSRFEGFNGFKHMMKSSFAKSGIQRQSLEQYSLGRGHFSFLEGLRSQSKPVKSQLPEATVSLSGENATDQIGPLCPANRCRSLPWATSQRRTVLSQLPEANILPFGEKVTDKIGP